MGLLSEGWVWMLTNDMSPAIRDTVDSPEELAEYDGLMFISGLWDCKCNNDVSNEPCWWSSRLMPFCHIVSGISAYDDMQREWQSQSIPANL